MFVIVQVTQFSNNEIKIKVFSAYSLESAEQQVSIFKELDKRVSLCGIKYTYEISEVK